MNGMVGDLLDFTRIRLGEGVPVVRAEVDLGKIAKDSVAEMTAAQPQRRIVLRTEGDLAGQWDSARLAQVFTNLLSNAVQYGSPDDPITMIARGSADEVQVEVHNSGPPIPTESLGGLFSPLKRIASHEATSRPSDNLGLGLYIADRIVTAHGGSIDVASSSGTGTTFTLHLPR
jgi:signal transduction histidine kinase